MDFIESLIGLGGLGMRRTESGDWTGSLTRARDLVSYTRHWDWWDAHHET